jgi:hypothetical protein
MPFDAQYEQQLRAIQDQQAGLASQEGVDTSRVQNDFGLQAQQLAQQREQAQRALYGKMAGQGILRSSINVDQQRNLGNQYLQDYSGMQTNRTRTLEDIARDYVNRRYGLNQQAEQAGYQRTQRAEQQALESARAAAEALVNKRYAKRKLSQAAKYDAAIRRLRK